MHEHRTQRLSQFVEWASRHISGDEKGEAQIFLDRLFQSFGQPGLLEVGGHPEFRIRKSSEDGGGTAFADYVWKPIVLVEMKKRGTVLAKHHRQASEYWMRLVPNRPQYVILCNFDSFEVYDFNKQIDTPVDTLSLKELPNRWGPLAFLFPTNEKPHFLNDRVEVTRAAADRLAECFNKLTVRKVDPALAQRFILQMLVALFSEDIGLLPKYLVASLLDDCKSPSDSYDLLGGLFAAMNDPRGASGGRYKGVRYFNGGLFSDPARIELHDDEINQLKRAAESDWSKVSPDIFGTLFEHSLGKEQRHAFGAHYTSPLDIMKIVRPTIVDPWTAAIDSARSAKRLLDLLERLTTLRILDPACGSGNFLYLAYREMKRLESRIRERLTIEFPDTQPRLIHVNARQFFGLDINPFAIELAKVTMMIARKLAIDELHISDEAALPLDNLDHNFTCTDALMTPAQPPAPSPSSPRPGTPAPLSPRPGTPGRGQGEGLLPPDATGGLCATGSLSASVAVSSGATGSSPASAPDPSLSQHSTLSPQHFLRTPWPPADIIIGNPPFLGAKRLKPERGADYVNALRKLYPEIPGMADYCVHWFRRAHDHLPPCTPDDPLIGRAGLVGTQNIRNNQSRVGGLDYVAASGTILEAVDNQPWSGEANVHVSIVNWIKSQDGAILPKKCRLWSKIAPGSNGPKQRRSSSRVSANGRGESRADKEYELSSRDCDVINPALSDQSDVSAAVVLRCNTEPQRCFTGQMIGHDGFILEANQRKALLSQDPRTKQILFPYLNGREFLTGDGTFDRFVLDFGQRDQLQAAAFQAAFKYVQQAVLPDRQRKAKEGVDKDGNLRPHHKQFLARWWQLAFPRPELIGWIERLSRFIVCSRVTKRPVLVFVSPEIRPGDALSCFAFDDDYSFGILQSSAHWLWFTTKCSKLTERFRYTPESVFDTFPWPQSPTKAQIDAVAEAGRQIRRIRDQALSSLSGGLRALYRTLELPGQNPLKDAHAALDSAVLSAYGFTPKSDLLSQLLDLNLAVSTSERLGHPVTPPGIPQTYGDPAPLITDDCIRP